MRRFRLHGILRVLGIGLTMLVALYLWVATASYVAAAIVTVAVGFQLVGLIHYVETTNRDLSRFLRSIRYSDFSQTFTGRGRGASFEELGDAFSEVMDDFRAARSETEEQHRYLQTVIQHVGIGLLSFRADGSVGLINNAAKRLLRVPHLNDIQALEDVSPLLVEHLFQMRSGDKRLVKVVDGDELLQLAVYATEFKLRDDRYTLVSIQDIQSELEEKEIEAWQRLTRVLTHEIMNSITPIASLASTVNELLAEEEGAALVADNGTTGGEVRADVREAVRTIERRSQGLLTFVQAYRQLTRIPKPDFRIVPVAQVFGDVERLMRPQMQARGIRFTTQIEPATLDLTADPEQIEQVVLNLLKNAMQAVEGIDGAEVHLTARIDGRGRMMMQVRDNGPGIVPEALDKIFIPFYSTKKDGSGIGLSFSREVMRQHAGTLSVTSDPGVRTTFTLRF